MRRNISLAHLACTTFVLLFISNNYFALEFFGLPSSFVSSLIFDYLKNDLAIGVEIRFVISISFLICNSFLVGFILSKIIHAVKIYKSRSHSAR